jgi:hypothetical protein
MRIARIVDVIPADHSNETNSDGETSVTVNPNNPAEMVITAFTPPEAGSTNGPVFFSIDGGENWSLHFDVPGGMPIDQTVSFASASNELHMAVMNGGNANPDDTGKLNVLRSDDPVSGGTFPVIKKGSFFDQPWVESATVRGGDDNGKDRVYVGYNDTLHSPKSATVEICLDAGAATPTFKQVRLDPRDVSPQNGFEIRPTIHRDGTVYIAYKGWRSGDTTHVITDIVVARDDNWGAGGSPFTALKDPGDGKAGRLVATGLPITDPAYLYPVSPPGSGEAKGIRLNNDLNVAVDPTNSDVVYVVWCDNVGPSYTLRVRRSVNRGTDWSDDLLTVDNASMASLTVNGRGIVGLLYQQLIGGQLETHFRTSADGAGWDDTLLARTALTDEFIGDYARLVSVAGDFYGVFSAVNTPNPANFFPNGGGTVRFQRSVSGTSLVGLDGTTVIAPSLDPFFFKVLERDLAIVTDRSTFGKDEIDAMLHLATPAVVDAAFYVVVDGFRAQDLNIGAATFSGVPDVAPAVLFNPPRSAMSVQAVACSASEDQNNLTIPQRFTWTYAVIFGDDSDFVQEIEDIIMGASITSIGGITVTGQAVITLTTQPNPYEIDGPVSWLSTDLRVFKLLRGGALPSTPDVAITNGPNDFITRLVQKYNALQAKRAPDHPFDHDLSTDEHTSQLTIAGTESIFQIPVFNFAVARVRYRALTTQASNVRVFFRLFQAATTTTSFQPTTTYFTGGQGGAKIPGFGIVNGEVVTIPCFAAPRVDLTAPGGLNNQTDPVNVQIIPPDSSGAEVQAYFGCWLDINQTTPVVPVNPTDPIGPFTGPFESVQQAIVRSPHQCVVSEINLDPPEPQIAVGQTAATSDKLAQRNLAIIGVASPHLVPQTFDIAPTALALPPHQTPDELMIDWGKVPPGTQASIFLPGANADAILSKADKLYGRHGLLRADAHTLSCEANGITYLPIPPGVGSNFAGLITVELPATVKKGQAFKVIARQIANVSARRPTPAPPILLTEAPGAAAVVVTTIAWRRIIGAFQISIPVTTRALLLEPEVRLLSVLRWIAKAIPERNRWHRVFERYLKQIEVRVEALGGDPSEIYPSSTGDGGFPEHEPPGPRVESTGKIAGLLFDRFGDFEGFLLETQKGERKFLSRETEMEALADRAWRERLHITVCADRDEPRRPTSIVVRKPPAPFRR